MSQERTETYTFGFDETEQMFLRLFSDTLIHGLTINQQKAALSDLLTARREEDRLNAVITEKDDAIDEWKEWYEAALKKIDDLTAKVHEQDETISDLERSVDDREWVINERDKKIAYQRSKLAELDEADAWAEYWRREALRNHPTQEAYDAACAALEKHKERADAGDKENGRLLAALKRISAIDIYENETLLAKQIADEALEGAQ